MLKVAIIGLGTVSPVHVRAIQLNKDAELVALCDIDVKRADKFPNIPFYDDITTLLAEAEIDVVHICLPHYLHYPITKQCVEAGKHVFLEKPSAVSFAEAQKLVELEATTDRKICVSMQNRYNQSFVTLQTLLAKNNEEIKGLKGTVLWSRTEEYYNAEPWRGKKKEAGFGTVINQAIHTLDLLQLLGGKLVSCKASLVNLTNMDIEVEDTATALFTFENGATGYFNSTNAYADNSSVELQVLTANHKYTIKDNALYETNTDGAKVLIVEDDKLPGTKFYYGMGHEMIINHYYTCIHDNLDDYVSAADAQATMIMIDGMDQSSRNNQKEIKL